MNKNSSTSKFPPLRSGGGLGRGPAFLLSLFLAVILFSPGFAAEPITFQYIYDDTGQLIKVIDSTGTMVEYSYDETGNRIGVQRSTVSGLAIFHFTPGQGPMDTIVTLQGQGFSALPADNLVKFNGTAATVQTATTNSLTVQVPAGAATGPVSVTLAAETAVSGSDFIVTNAPVMTAILPAIVASKQKASVIIPDLQVTGHNLSGATFGFLPVFDPPALTLNSATVDPTGTTASLNLSLSPGAAGSFTLVATNGVGDSETVPTAANTLVVLKVATDSDHDLIPDFEEAALCTNPLNPDTDGDGFSDKDEIDFSADPCNASSTPADVPAAIRVALGPSLSVINRADPPIDPLGNAFIGEAIGPSLSVINQADPPIDPLGNAFIGEALGPSLSVINQADPPIDLLGNAFIGEALGPSLSVINQADPPIDPLGNAFIGEALGPSLSVINRADPPIDPLGNAFIGEALGPALSIESGP